MAWNQFYIFVKGPSFDNLEATLTSLDLGGYKPVGEVELHQTSKPTTLFAGVYNGNLVLVHPDLVFEFFRHEQSEVEQLFIRAFPEAEIAALIINETVGLFGFALIVAGRKVRMKEGCDGEYYIDIGDQLPEEQEVLSRDEEELEGMREELRDEDLADEEIEAMVQFEASYRVPNLLTARYLGEPVMEMSSQKVVPVTRYEHP